MQNKLIVIQKFYRKRKWKIILAHYKIRLYVGWDKKKKNIIFINSDDGIFNSIFVKIYSLEKLKIYYESFLINELINGISFLDKESLLKNISMFVDKIIEIFNNKCGVGVEEFKELNSNNQINSAEHKPQPKSEKDNYSFSDDEITNNIETNKPKVDKINNESLSSIQEIDYQNI
jgi:hypothetical protein